MIGEPAGQPRDTWPNFDGEELTRTYAPVTVAGFLHMDVERDKESETRAFTVDVGEQCASCGLSPSLFSLSLLKGACPIILHHCSI